VNTFILSVEGAGFYRGHNVKINGVQVAHRPYDGSGVDTVELEVAEALGELIREKLGWNEEAPEQEEEDW
jgi:hypothetical protein